MATHSITAGVLVHAGADSPRDMRWATVAMAGVPAKGLTALELARLISQGIDALLGMDVSELSDSDRDELAGLSIGISDQADQLTRWGLGL